VPVLVDHVDDDLDIRYRRYKADWLRVLPIGDEDDSARERCARYGLAIVPAAPA